MFRSRLFVLACALTAFSFAGCSDSTSTGATGGAPGDGGTAGGGAAGGTVGTGGAGGMAGVGGAGGGAGGMAGAGGVGGGAELCIGDDATGDTDDDGVCDSDDVCPGANDLIDVDDNSVADCLENLLSNSELDSDETGWEERTTDARVGWDALDADGDPRSGSVTVTNIEANPNFVNSVGQCVQAPEGRYVAAGRYYIPGGQGPGEGRLNVTFHANTSCIGGAGNFLGNSASAWETATGTWATMLHPFSTVSGTQSIAFIMSAKVLDTSPAFTVQFDNLLMRCDEAPVMLVRDYTGGGGAWYGGDNRSLAGAPRLVAAGVQVPVTETFTAQRFALYLVTRFDFAEDPELTGHAVTLVAQLRDASGMILEAVTTDLDVGFAGGWVYWDFDTVLQAGQTYNFTTYLQDGFTSGLKSSIGFNNNDPLPSVLRLACNVGHDSADQPLIDVDDWSCWGAVSSAIAFRLEGATVCD